MDEAIRQFRRAIQIDPRYAKAHNNLGVALLDAGPTQPAVNEFMIALAADPRNVEALVNLALVAQRENRPAEARDLLRRAVSIDPRNPGLHYNFAAVADRTGDREQAIEHYRAFLRFVDVAHTSLVPLVRNRLATLGAS